VTPFVLDTSVTVAWCFEDQSTPYTDAVLQALIDGAEAVVPAIWRLEVANALVVAERRKKITAEASTQFLLDLQQFNITVDTDGLSHVFGAVIEHARLHQRSSYDASYLELAERRGLLFATKDEPLKKATEALGISLLQL
jgi:predicted nucleic acid-binding protein